jgi:hypothetical protein
MAKRKQKRKHKQVADTDKRSRLAFEAMDAEAESPRYRGPEGTVGVFARVSVQAYDILIAATKAANAGRGLGNGNRVTMGTVLERCIVQTLAGAGVDDAG